MLLTIRNLRLTPPPSSRRREATLRELTWGPGAQGSRGILHSSPPDCARHPGIEQRSPGVADVLRVTLQQLKRWNGPSSRRSRVLRSILLSARFGTRKSHEARPALRAAFQGIVPRISSLAGGSNVLFGCPTITSESSLAGVHSCRAVCCSSTTRQRHNGSVFLVWQAYSRASR